jgi:DNA invertase Pin-like site-specific DNA recombinase
MAKRATSKDAKRAIGYLRVSTSEQALGPEAQRAAILEWARRSGAEIVGWHEDRGISGAAPIDERPGLLSALADLEELEAGALIVAKRDRLARDVMVAAMIERFAAKAGARIISAAGEGTEGEDPASQLMRSMIDAFAQYERAMIAARTKAALAAKKARGDRLGGPRFGERRDESGRFEEIASEREAIEIMRALRAEGLSLREIADELTARGCQPRGGRWHATTIMRALRAA